MDTEEEGSSELHNGAYDMGEIKDELEYLQDIPKAIIFTNLPAAVFDKHETNPVRNGFEEMLQRYDRDISIAYLPNFHRARVEFSSSSIAALVKYELHKSDLHGKEIKAFFVKVPPLYDSTTRSTLNPPKLEKQFLISPPASPPVGWEPITEHEPVIDYDLVNAMMALGPGGGAHELHAGCETLNIPKIVIHLTPDDGSINPNTLSNASIPHTRRPPDP
ncbi:calcipressin-2-like [Watersipora subatra]|uniref:calcipressin-2-like n=1 Tax=Watersipora subatra TaxID=2589382 RepID=UPI00355C1B8C